MAEKMTLNRACTSCDTASAQETKPSDSATFMQRIGLCLLALILCVGLMPSLAWAADDDDGTFSVALTIVNTVVDDGASADVVYNEAVSGMTDSMTVADLLEAAGFSKVDTLDETADNRTTYYEDDGWPDFLGLSRSGSNDWEAMLNGVEDFSGAKLNTTLIENGHYQYIYGSSQTFSYTDDIPDPLPSESGGDNTMNANPYDVQAANTLLENLKTRFSVGGANSSLTNETAYAAIALNSLGLSDQVDTDAVYSNFLSYMSEGSAEAGRLAKYIFILSAADINCAQFTVDYNGETRGILATMESLVDPASMDIYTAVWVLGVYGYGNYEQGADCAMSIDELVSFIMNHRDSSGLFGDASYGYDTETTAQALLALRPYADTEGVGDAINTAVETLQTFQNEDDGGYGYSTAYPQSDIDATAMVVTALTVLGNDVTQEAEFTTANGSSPIGYLTAEADEDLTGYTTNESLYNEPMTASTVFMALASTQAVEDTTTAGSGTTGSETEPTTTTTTTTTTTPSTTTSTSTVPSTSSSSTPNTTTSTSSTPSSNSTLAQTGDTETPALALTVGAVALCALASALVAARRMRKTH